MIMIGPKAHRPKQPVLTTLTSSVSPAAAISFSISSMISWLLEEEHPVPPQIRTCERYMVLPPYFIVPTLPMV